MKAAPTVIPQWLGILSYAAGLELQEKYLGEIISGSGPERLLLLEHEAVYTIGRTRDKTSLGESAVLPHPVFEINRGGQATYHGPGQLVGYPILDLSTRGRDLHHYLRFLEEVLIALCAVHGVPAHSREGLTGVWVGERKIASLGVGVRKWITMHGFAINICESACREFAHITPCGLPGVEMTSLERECGHPVEVETAASQAGEIFLRMLPDAIPAG